MLFKIEMGQPRPLFRLSSVFSNKHQYNFLQLINVKNVNSIQYTEPGCYALGIAATKAPSYIHTSLMFRAKCEPLGHRYNGYVIQV